MKLTKEQVLYIDDYLIKNRVKYWDVRIELLDHIVRAIEDKRVEGQTFEEALLEVHRAFGNKASKISLNRNTTAYHIERSLFLDHSGYAKLIRNKGIAFHLRYQKTTFLTFWKLLSLPGLILGSVLLFAMISPEKIALKTDVFQTVMYFVIVGFLVGQLVYMFAKNLNVSAKKDLVSARYLFNIFSPAQLLNYLYLSFGNYLVDFSGYIYILISLSLVIFNFATFMSIEEHRRNIIRQFPYLKSKLD